MVLREHKLSGIFFLDIHASPSGIFRLLKNPFIAGLCKYKIFHCAIVTKCGGFVLLLPIMKFLVGGGGFKNQLKDEKSTCNAQLVVISSMCNFSPSHISSSFLNWSIIELGVFPLLPLMDPWHEHTWKNEKSCNLRCVYDQLVGERRRFKNGLKTN